MQRLFSMFPTGTTGAALLVLRVSVAVTVTVCGTAHWAPATSFWTPFAIAILAISLFLGLFTPYCAAIVCIIEAYLFVLSSSRDQFHLIMSVVDSGILAVLGPGAYSIDARLFGRKLLTVPLRR